MRNHRGVQGEREARLRLYWYFRETLRLLPPELSLSVEHPELPHARFRAGITLPVGDDDESELENFDICYWVVGSAPEESDRHFRDVVRVWRDLGWPLRVHRDRRPRTTAARTGEGYSFSVAQSAEGYLSLSGVTPPYYAEPVPGRPFPPVIEHPGPAGPDQ